MASATSAFASKEIENYYRLCCLLVEVGSEVLRKTFDKVRPSGNLDKLLADPRISALLRSLRKKGVLSSSQWDKLYPSVGSAVSSKQFDIALLGILLSSICNLQPPETGWNEFPPGTDTTIQADIIRIRFYDTMVRRLSNWAKIDDRAFNFFWKNIQDTLVSLGGECYRKPIDHLKRERLNADCEEHFDMLFIPKGASPMNAITSIWRLYMSVGAIGKNLFIECIYFKFPISLYLIAFDLKTLSS